MTAQSSVRRRPAQRRYLALWFPFLATDRLLRARPPAAAPDDRPFACIETVRGAMRIAAADPRALALGVMPGMALADARVLLPELDAVPADPLADQAWLERIADQCDRYTPMVALDPADGVTLDVTGCAHLFGGEAGLAAAVEGRMRAATDHLRHAFAGTPEAAQALARFQTAPAGSEDLALRRLGVAALRMSDEIATALRRAGLKTIGDLAGLPGGPLTARFGAETSDALARLLGRVDSRIRPRRAAPALFFERRFADPIARTDDVLATIAALAAEAAGVLADRDRGGRRFAVRLYRSDGDMCDLAVESGLPVRDPGIVTRLFRERVAALADPLDPGFGYDMIRLAIPAIEPLAATQLKLEGGAVHEEAMAALVDRLSMRLGRARICRLHPRDTHIPEQGVLVMAALDAPPAVAEAWGRLEPGEPPLRPIHLFDPPQRIEVMAEVPDGPPHRFRWRRTLHDVTRYEGPERIASEWWRRAEGTGLTRDYYRVEDRRGRRFWIFRHGLYERETGDPDWYVHGLFA